MEGGAEADRLVEGGGEGGGGGLVINFKNCVSVGLKNLRVKTEEKAETGNKKKVFFFFSKQTFLRLTKISNKSKNFFFLRIVSKFMKKHLL